MRVLHVTAPARTGGLEAVVRGLASGHRQRGYDVHVAAALHDEENDHPFTRSLRAADVPVHEIRTSPRGYVRERRIVGDLCATLGADVVHTHGLRPDVVASSAASRRNLSLVTTLHGYVPNGWRGGITEWAQRRALRRFDAIVAVSRPLARRLTSIGIPSDRIHLVPNAWTNPGSELSREEARRALGVPEGRLHLGWVGRLGHEKGPDVFVEALGDLRDLPFVASVLGEGSMRPQLEARARELGVAERVRWKGLVEDAARLFPAFDLLVLSSRTEGTPIVLLEALSQEVPVVATSVGGIPDVVSDREAVLVPPEDPPRLSLALRRALGEPAADRIARTRRARAVVDERFGAARWLERYEAVYRTAARFGPCDRRKDWKRWRSS